MPLLENLYKLNLNNLYVKLLNTKLSSEKIIDVKITTYSSDEKTVYDVAYLIDLDYETFDKKQDEVKKLIIVPYKSENTNKEIEWNITKYYTNRYIYSASANDYC